MIRFHRLIVPGDVPTPTTFTDNDGGEGGIILQVADGLIYTLDDNGDVISIGGGGGGASDFVTFDTAVVAEVNQGYLAQTSLGSATVELPTGATLKQGSSVSVGDYDGLAFNNPITITRETGTTINGLDEDLILNVDYAVITLSYIEAEDDWRIVNGAGESSPPSFVAKDTIFQNVRFETTFSPDEPFQFKSGEGDVYYNDGRLNEGLNYTVNSDGSITLLTSVGSDEDVITLRVYNRAEVTDLTPLYDQVNDIDSRLRGQNILRNPNFQINQQDYSGHNSLGTVIQRTRVTPSDFWIFTHSSTMDIDFGRSDSTAYSPYSRRYLSVSPNNQISAEEDFIGIVQGVPANRIPYGQTVTFTGVFELIGALETDICFYAWVYTPDGSFTHFELTGEATSAPVVVASGGLQEVSFTVRMPTVDEILAVSPTFPFDANDIDSGSGRSVFVFNFYTTLGSDYGDRVSTPGVGHYQPLGSELRLHYSKLEIGSKYTGAVIPEVSTEVAEAHRYLYVETVPRYNHVGILRGNSATVGSFTLNYQVPQAMIRNPVASITPMLDTVWLYGQSSYNPQNLPALPTSISAIINDGPHAPTLRLSFSLVDNTIIQNNRVGTIACYSADTVIVFDSSSQHTPLS